MPSAYYPPPSTDPSKQPLDSTLTAFAGLPGGADRLPYFTGVDSLAQATFTAYARTLLDDPDAANARNTLGLGTMATQNSNNVSISGGDVFNCEVVFPVPNATTPHFKFATGGTAPTAPVNGWFWMVGAQMFARLNNQTHRINTTIV